MIFLPNKFARYTCALRNTLQILIMKNGIKSKYLNNLMKIHRAEALFSESQEPVNVSEFSNEILKAVFLKCFEKGEYFNFKVSQGSVYLMNKKLYISLLLSFCKTARKIEINFYKEKIFIKAFNVNLENNIKLLKKIKSNYFFETKNRLLYVLITLPKTNKKTLENKKDLEYFLNPLSEVNIYLN